MEGYFTAFIFSGAALVTAHRAEVLLPQLRAVIRFLTAALALGGLVALVWGFVLHEWLTVSWAMGLCGCCLAVGLPVGWRGWRERVSTVLMCTFATIGGVMSFEGLVPDATWAIAQAVAQVNYRDSAQFVMFGNGLLNLTAVLIAVHRLRYNALRPATSHCPEA